MYTMMTGTKSRIANFVYSLLVVFVGMSNYRAIKERFRFEFIASRKYFHLLGFVLFAPGFIYEV